MTTIECAICLENCKESFGQLSTCGHEFCDPCIKTWMISHSFTCPLDRSTPDCVQIYNNQHQRKLIETMKIVPKLNNDNGLVNIVSYLYFDYDGIEEEFDSEEPDNRNDLDYICDEDEKNESDDEIDYDEDDDNLSLDDKEISLISNCHYIDDFDDLSALCDEQLTNGMVSSQWYCLRNKKQMRT